MIRGEEITNIEYGKRFPFMSFSYSEKPSLVHYNHVKYTFNENSKMNVYNCEKTVRDGCDILYPFFNDFEDCFDKSEEIKPLILDFHKNDEFYYYVIKRIPELNFGVIGQGIKLSGVDNYTYEPFDLNLSNILKKYNLFLLMGYSYRDDEFGVSAVECMSTGARCVITENFHCINTKKIKVDLDSYIEEIKNGLNYNYRKDFLLYKEKQEEQIKSLLEKIKTYE